MNNMTDILEQYIQSLFKESEENHIVIKRSNVAEKFDCVPSQLNYVIKTRFTPEHGFFIESKRGGGGFIRITRITLHQEKDYIDYLIEKIDDFSSDLESTLKMLKILKDKNYINNFEYNHIEDSISSVVFLEQQFLQIATNDQIDIIKEKTKDSIKDLTIKFLTNIKYK